MRFAFALSLLVLAASASADRLITIPLGRKIPFHQIKFDTFAELSRARSLDRFVGIGVTPEIELDYHGERIDGGPLRDTFDASYNLVAPFTGLTPGISVGLQDGLNRTRNGRRAYLAVTFRNPVDNIGNGNLPLDVTLGISQGDRTRPFLGVSIPMSESLRLQVEHDGYRIASGLEYRLFEDAFGARLIVRDQDVMAGLNFRLKF